MNRLACALLALCATATLAEDRPPIEATAPSQVTTSGPNDPAALVQAAQAAKARRRTSTRKVITNKDLKKARSKLLTTGAPAATPSSTATRGQSQPKLDGKTTLQKADDRYRERLFAEGRVDKAEKKVSTLQAELARVEQDFYDENDPNYRDTVIQQRFAQAKRQLDAARKELAEAREALSALQNP